MGDDQVTYRRWVDVPEGLRTKTQWHREGYRIHDTAAPDAFFWSSYYRSEYSLYGPARVQKRRSRLAVPGTILGFSDGHLLIALRTINDAAKRRRDSAAAFYVMGKHGHARKSKRDKESLYELKDELLLD